MTAGADYMTPDAAARDLTPPQRLRGVYNYILLYNFSENNMTLY
jgi:hypothetical protein